MHTRTLEWVQGQERESVIKLFVQLTICNYNACHSLGLKNWILT